MKLKIFLLLFVISELPVFAQTASDYFPAQPGYKWYFESVPLDSLNNLINSLKFFGIDSFAVVTPYFGRNANLVLTKSDAQNTINFQPYLDSIFYSFETTNGFEYFDPVNVDSLLGNIDTTLGINFLNFFNSLKGWYSYYRFASANNVEYQVFKKDTAVTINSISATLRFELIGKKITDETIATAIGTFACKKFVMEVRLSYLILNIFPIKMFGVEDTLWFAPDNWKVKSYMPTTNIDLSYLGFPAFNIPGLETNITTPITNVETELPVIDEFKLYQNYPNPFNPTTTISWNSPISGRQTLKIYDVLGNEVATLVDEYRKAGAYEVEFNPASSIKYPASGIYFYKLKVNDFIQTRKMVLLR
jgi:hypothetical protein